MPIYTYLCSNCGVRFERKQKFEDEPLTYCPECHKKTLHKQISAVGIVFKGSGFYATDHRSPSGMNYASSSNDEKAADDKMKETKPKTEKPAEKPKSTEKEKSKD